MFYEDYNVVDNDYDDNDTFNSLKKNNNNIKSYDKGFHKIVKRLSDDKVNKKVLIEVYSTGLIGHYIRNALTGEYTKYKVGSNEQSLFFKVSNCLGVHKNTPIHFYYKSPEEYERHQFSSVDKVVKEKWMEKYMKIKKITLENKTD